MKHKVSVDELDQYMHYVHEKTKPQKSLNEFLQTDDNQRIIADLTSIDFTKHNFDLSFADLSGAILDNINFNGHNVILKGANLTGASLKGTKFTGQINLEKVKFGSIELTNQLFESCQLENAVYSPDASNIIMIRPTETMLNKYLALDSSKPNLNLFLTRELGYLYPKLNLVADLSGMTIDSKFNGADLSFSNLANCKITGQIDDLTLRDCLTHNTLFSNCHLKNVDLRGTNLAEGSFTQEKTFVGAKFEGQVRLESPKLSFGENLEMAENKGIIPIGQNSAFSITGTPTFDPCYRADQVDTVRTYAKFTKEDVEKYCKAVRTQQASGSTPSFHEFMNLKETIVPDFSELNLNGLDLSGAIFTNCNFSYSTFNGCKLDNAIFNYCNFSGCSFSTPLFAKKNIPSKYPVLSRLEDYAKFALKQAGVEYKHTSMQNTNFSNCNLTWADLAAVTAKRAIFNDVTGVNLYARGADLSEGAQANRANFVGANLDEVDASGITAEEIDLSHSTGVNSKFNRATMHFANFTDSQYNGADFTSAKLTASNFFKAKLKAAKLEDTLLNQARMGADISKAKINANMKNADCSNMNFADNAPPTIANMNVPIQDPNSLKAKLRSEETDITNTKKDVYNKYAFRIIVATALFTAAIPLIIMHLAPTLIAATVINSMMSASIITVSALACDLAMENILGFSPGANKMVANFFGAEGVARIQAEQAKNNINQISNERNALINERSELHKSEQEISRNANKRYQELARQNAAPEQASFLSKLISRGKNPRINNQNQVLNQQI